MEKIGGGGGKKKKKKRWAWFPGLEKKTQRQSHVVKDAVCVGRIQSKGCPIALGGGEKSGLQKGKRKTSPASQQSMWTVLRTQCAEWKTRLWKKGKTVENRTNLKGNCYTDLTG